MAPRTAVTTLFLSAPAPEAEALDSGVLPDPLEWMTDGPEYPVWDSLDILIEGKKGKSPTHLWSQHALAELVRLITCVKDSYPSRLFWAGPESEPLTLLSASRATGSASRTWSSHSSDWVTW